MSRNLLLYTWKYTPEFFHFFFQRGKTCENPTFIPWLQTGSFCLKYFSFA